MNVIKQNMQNSTEEQLHKQICDYLHLQYPKVLFNTDMSGIKLTAGQAKKVCKLRSGRGFPDITIYGKKAIFIEVKKESPFNKNGDLKHCWVYPKNKPKYDRFSEQNEWHERLRAIGFVGGFFWNFDATKIFIDNQLK